MLANVVSSTFELKVIRSFTFVHRLLYFKGFSLNLMILTAGITDCLAVAVLGLYIENNVRESHDHLLCLLIFTFATLAYDAKDEN